MAISQSQGGHPWSVHCIFHLFDLIWWFCEQLMRSLEEIRVRASCYDNRQYGNSRRVRLGPSVMPGSHFISRARNKFDSPFDLSKLCSSSRVILFASWDEWRRTSGITMVSYFMCSFMLLTCLTKLFDCYLRVASDD